MTVETVVKVEGEEKRSDLSMTSVGTGVGCGGVFECNGGGGDNSKDEYVFVSDSDVTLDDHGVVVEGNGGLKEGGDGDHLAMDVCNDFRSKVGDNVVVMVNGKEAKGESEFVVENGEVEKGLIEDKEVVIENCERVGNEGEVDVNEHDVEVVEESCVRIKENGVKVVVEGDERDSSVDVVDSSLLDDDNKGGCDSLQNGSTVVEIESQVHCGEIEEQCPEGFDNLTNESEKLGDEVRKSEVVEGDVNSLSDAGLVTESGTVDGVVKELESVEAHRVHEAREDDHNEIGVADGETMSPECGESEVLLSDDVIIENLLTENQQQDLQPAADGELDSLETGDEVKQGDLQYLDSETTVNELQQSVEIQDASGLIIESEESPEPQGVPEQSAVLDKESIAALVPSELYGSTLESSGQCDETTAESTQEVAGNSDTSTVDLQSDELDKRADDHGLDTVAHVERSLDSSVQVDSPLDQVVEDTGLVNGIDVEISSEDVVSSDKATTFEETASSLIQISADEAVLDEGSKDLEHGVPQNDVTAPLALPVLHDTDIIKEPGDVDDCSYVSESSSLANLENHIDALPYFVNNTDIKAKPVSDGFHDLSENCGSEGTLVFGSFVCQTKANGVTSSLEDVNTRSIADGVPTSFQERSVVPTSFTDADAQVVVDEISASPVEESRADSTDGETANPVRTPFHWLIKVPRLDNVEFEQIKQFHIEFDKKTQDRDASRKAYQERLNIYRESMAKLHAAKAEKEASYQSMMSKKREIDSAQSLLKLARDGNTVERIDGQILNMEQRIQHETLNLAEEKRLIREIKQLNHQREQLAADTQGQQEVYQAVGRRVQTEEQLKVLRKEMEVLRENYGKAFESFKAVERKCEEEYRLKQKSEAEFKSFARIQDAAYERIRTLKQQAYEKNKPCYIYRDVRTTILNLKAGEEESLEQLCVNQVESFMELWNKNDEFRKEYIRCNMRSTLRRFNALDGRDLSNDEKKPVLEDSSDNGVALTKVNSVGTALISETEFPLAVKKTKDYSSNKVEQQKNTNALTKKSSETTSNNSLAEPSGRIEKVEKEEGPKLTKEEEELAREAEEKRREEEAERLKEQRRREEKAKAQEALERKKRMAEKAQARAKFRAEKEAEEKKKEREKKARKKGKKKGLISEAAEAEPSEVPELITEPEVTEILATVAKKSHKPAALLYTKQVKTTKSIPVPPAPLRNRGKRRVPEWAWWLVLAVLAALLIFLWGT